MPKTPAPPRVVLCVALGVSLCVAFWLMLVSVNFGWRAFEFVTRTWWPGSPSVRTRTTLLVARRGLEQFVRVRGRCPTSDAELIEGRFVSKALTDDWGTRLHYDCDLGPDGPYLEVDSAGPDRVFGTVGDLSTQDH